MCLDGLGRLAHFVIIAAEGALFASALPLNGETVVFELQLTAGIVDIPVDIIVITT